VGSGGILRGIAVGGIGVGAPTIRGLALAGFGVGGENVTGAALAGGYFKIADDGRLDGVGMAAVTNVRGVQHGLTIGLFNYAHDLHGTQIGLINISDNGGSRRVIPVISIR
jgi:hypothetical protein